MKLSEFIQAYLLQNDIAPKYGEQLLITAKLFSRWIGRDPEMDAITSQQVNLWLVAYAETPLEKTGRKPSKVTVRGKKSMLSTLLRAAAEDGLCEVPHGLRRINAKPGTPRGWRLNQAKQFADYCKSIPGYCPRSGIKWSAWWTAFVGIAWDSGLRLGDIITVENDRPANCCDGLTFAELRSGVRVQHKTGQSKVLMLREETIAAIHATWPPEREPVLPWHQTRWSFYDSFKSHAKAAGLEGTARWLRKGATSEIENMRPGAGKEFLGHSSDGLIKKFYADPTIARPATPMPPGLGTDQAPDSEVLRKLVQDELRKMFDRDRRAE